MGKLRDQMQRDMELKNLSSRTKRCYPQWMSRFGRHYRKPPDQLGDAEIKKDIKCGCVVGADGFESQVGRWAGINTSLAPRDITTCFQYRLTNIDQEYDYCEFILRSKAPGGYIWIFPKDKDTSNVGLGIQLTKLKDPAEVKKYLDKFIQSDPRLRKGRPLEMVSGAVSICAPIERTIADGVLLVGDSARQIDPITGGGISTSCKAAKAAGEVLGKAAKERNFSERSLQRP